ELAFAELSPAAATALEKAGVDRAWDGHGPLITSLLDLIEVSEIPRLGRATEDGAPQHPTTVGA
ncbi:MAG TPA: hypothetical protein VK689_21370, partial [Armatimonadota bacterium]|nr:hypothetical protein [Armatimonadota bacterium]